jgi:hypothetical protein
VLVRPNVDPVRAHAGSPLNPPTPAGVPVAMMSPGTSVARRPLPPLRDPAA